MEGVKEQLPSFLNSLTALVYALEAKDKFTVWHSHHVANIAAAIAQELGLPLHKVDKIAVSGLIHDIGKVGVRPYVLAKPGKLTEEEYQHLISHCEIGVRILRPVVEDEEILDMVMHHHEHYDGTGYPHGLSGNPLPKVVKVSVITDTYDQLESDFIMGKKLSQNASILAIADAYDAMLSPRSYRGALSVAEAEEEIRRGAGTQFAPDVVDAFLRIKDSMISLYEEIEKQGGKQAEWLAKERTKSEAKEAKKDEEAKRQAKIEAEGIFNGHVYLSFTAPGNYEQLTKNLGQVKNLKIL
ncbi:HD-GYP domain-containing protein [Chloroflexota bacterium]